MAQPNNWQNLPLAALPVAQLQQAIGQINYPHAPDHHANPEVRRADGNAQGIAAGFHHFAAPPPGQAQPNLTAIDQHPEHQRNWGVVEQPNMNIMQLHAPHPVVAQAQMLIFPQLPPEIFPS